MKNKGLLIKTEKQVKALRKLCLLDLDHTLIYGSYAPSEDSELLFQYNQYLKVYKRPFVDHFLHFIKNFYTDIIIYTTAKRDYAKRISKDLNINAIQILSRRDCSKSNNGYIKTIRKEWIDNYDQIHIIDDSPHVWDTNAYPEKKFLFIIPKEFRGSSKDLELKNIMDTFPDAT